MEVAERKRRQKEMKGRRDEGREGKRCVSRSLKSLKKSENDGSLYGDNGGVFSFFFFLQQWFLDIDESSFSLSVGYCQ